MRAVANLQIVLPCLGGAPAGTPGINHLAIHKFNSSPIKKAVLISELLNFYFLVRKDKGFTWAKATIKAIFESKTCNCINKIASQPTPELVC
ncbi:MAG: hypothetical protein ACI9EW_000351 [Cellvibrionaceae bacterium]|jgi:hypothetical protein